jgi:hypothetical protein
MLRGQSRIFANNINRITLLDKKIKTSRKIPLRIIQSFLYQSSLVLILIFLFDYFYLAAAGHFSEFYAMEFLYASIYSSIIVTTAFWIIVLATRFISHNLWTKVGLPFISLKDANVGSNANVEGEIAQYLNIYSDIKPSQYFAFGKTLVIRDLEERISRLRRRSETILIVIGIILLGAAVVIIFAGNLASIDANAVSNVDRIQSAIDNHEQKLSRLEHLASLLGQQLALQPANASTSEPSAPGIGPGSVSQVIAGQTRNPTAPTNKDGEDNIRKKINILREIDSSLPDNEAGTKDAIATENSQLSQL